MLGHVLEIYTNLSSPPKDKITICICADSNLFFWINTNPRRHGIAQFPLTSDDHGRLNRDCFLDCSRVTTFGDIELSGAQDHGCISTELASKIVEYLENNPPKTLPPVHMRLAIENLSSLHP